jgi:hypothetical protein
VALLSKRRDRLAERMDQLFGKITITEEIQCNNLTNKSS